MEIFPMENYIKTFTCITVSAVQGTDQGLPIALNIPSAACDIIKCKWRMIKTLKTKNSNK